MQKKNVPKSIRLSKNVLPQVYNIQLRPDLENFTFEGIETIHISILQNTKTIIVSVPAVYNKRFV